MLRSSFFRWSAVVLAQGLGLTAIGQAAEFRVERDVSYLGPERSEKADLYLPTEGTNRPAVVMIHGGGWTGGDKGAKREINVCSTLAEHGFVALSINYRLGRGGAKAVAWPQNLQDCKTAVRWLRVHAGDYALDAAHIGVIGGSAGGHLASLVGVTQPRDGLEPTLYPEQSSAVSCVVDLYGAIQLGVGPIDAQSDPRTMLKTYLDPKDPPFLIIHGTADKIISIERSREFAADLQQAGVVHELIELEGAPHTFDLQPKQRDLRPVVLAFFTRYLKPSTPSP
jgi:acetyl esterase/lipase